MASDPNDVIALARLIAKHSLLINLVSMQLADQAGCVIASLERCTRCERSPVTVQHRHLSCRCCDRCAAEMIVLSTRNYVDGCINQHDDPLNDVRASLMNEHDWVDVAEASRIRSVQAYVSLVNDYELRPSRLDH